MNGAPVDLDNCAREPIHLSGAIQPHGVLLVLDPDSLQVLRASENVASLLGVPLHRALSSTLDELLVASSVQRVRDRAARLGSRRAPRSTALSGKHVATAFDGILHVSNGLLVLELEPTPVGEAFADFDAEMRDSLSHLHEAASVEDLCRVGVVEIKRLTQFDRVMAYRFDADGHGHVIAEAKREDLESYLDLHYPASDIPAQARRLYTVNWLRSIGDVAYVPVPILPALDDRGAPLDLSFSVLRSVSPMHVHYLLNMGVHGSMSISVVVEGRLWGMFICHHYTPRFVPYEVRVAAEFMAQMLSWQIGVRDRADSIEHRSDSEARLRTVTTALRGAGAAEHEWVDAPEPLLALVDARGVCVVRDGRRTLAGQTPDSAELDALVAWLAPELERHPYATHALSRAFPAAASFAAVASGLLAVPLLGDGKSFILWFRPEQVQTVSWAGMPEKVVTHVAGEARLSPRGSFALWRETVQQQSVRWETWQTEIAVELARAVAAGWASQAAEIEQRNQHLQAAAEELREAGLAKDDFLATVSHELRNPLNVILGWVRLLQSDALPPERRTQGVDVIGRHAKHQAKLIDDLLDVSRIVSGKLRIELVRVDLSELVALTIESLRPAAEEKGLVVTAAMERDVPTLQGDPVRLQQVLWNVLHNAVKFTPTAGRIDVRVTREGQDAVLRVQDSGKGISAALLGGLFERFRQAEVGPARSGPGLGLGLSIVRHLVELHGGTVTADSAGDDLGSTFTVRLPLERAESETGDVPTCPALAGKTVLVVDDEEDARLLLDVQLVRCGARVLLAGSAAQALSFLASSRADLILSDIGMPNGDGYELLRKIRSKGVAEGGRTPAIALTAYARAEDRTSAFRAGFQAHVAKPVDLAELFSVIASLLRVSAAE